MTDVAHVLTDEEGQALLPSVVNFGDEVTVGHAALELAVVDPENCIILLKRLIVNSRDDLIKNQKSSLIDSYRLAFAPRHGNKTPVEVSSEILNVLAGRARTLLEAEEDGVVLTVPA